MLRPVPIIILSLIFLFSCSKKEDAPAPIVAFTFKSASVNGVAAQPFRNVDPEAVIRFQFSAPVKKPVPTTDFTFRSATDIDVPFSISYENHDSVVVITPTSPLGYIGRYTVTALSRLKSFQDRPLGTDVVISFNTKIDSTRKFPTLTDNELLDKIQSQTFKYFWDYGHPVSGLARERTNWEENIVATGGSGFGVLAIITGIHRGFITRAEGFNRLKTIVAFLKNAEKVKGAFSHWMNGTTGAIVPFSANDNGADLVETSYLIQALLTARQYFNGASMDEVTFRNDVNAIWNGVEWDWFRRGGQDVLYWHYSNNNQWAMNMQIRGWNEALITYVLAASSTTHGVPPSVYHNGWAGNGSIRNGATYYGHQLPLGPDRGGPLFLSQYSFLGINPNGLVDTYADYDIQTRNHALIHHEYAKLNPQNHFGYSDSVWGLTASDIPGGYTASSPTNDRGVIAPTAALGSFPFTPVESMKAAKFYYYVLGDKLWNSYGFADAFSLKDGWFAPSQLAIDQGPIIIMIENHRSGLLWDLFTSCPEVQQGMRNLGFTAPYL